MSKKFERISRPDNIKDLQKLVQPQNVIPQSSMVNNQQNKVVLCDWICYPPESNKPYIQSILTQHLAALFQTGVAGNNKYNSDGPIYEVSLINHIYAKTGKSEATVAGFHDIRHQGRTELTTLYDNIVNITAQQLYPGADPGGLGQLQNKIKHINEKAHNTKFEYPPLTEFSIIEENPNNNNPVQIQHQQIQISLQVFFLVYYSAYYTFNATIPDPVINKKTGDQSDLLIQTIKMLKFQMQKRHITSLKYKTIGDLLV